jgi:hypothetical protein
VIARYILCILWGAALASGWWASSIWWWGVPIGPNNFPAVGFLTGVLTLITLVAASKSLVDRAIEGKP